MKLDLQFSTEEIVKALIMYAYQNGRLPGDTPFWNVKGITAHPDEEELTIILHDVTARKENR